MFKAISKGVIVAAAALTAVGASAAPAAQKWDDIRPLKWDDIRPLKWDDIRPLKWDDIRPLKWDDIRPL